MARIFTRDQQKAMFAKMRGEGGKRAAGVITAGAGLLLAKKGKGFGKVLGLGLAAAGGALAGGLGDRAITEAKARAVEARSAAREAGKFASAATSGYSGLLLKKARDVNIEKLVGGVTDLPFMVLEGKIAADMERRAKNVSTQAAKLIGGWSGGVQQAVAGRARQWHGKALGMSADEVALRTSKGGAALRETTKFLTSERQLRTTARDIKFRNAAISLLNETRRTGLADFRLTPALLEQELRRRGLTDTESNRKYLRFLVNAGMFMGTVGVGL